MAFNAKSFQTRSLSALIFVIVMLAGILYNQWSFLVLFSVVHFGCWIEYQKLMAAIYSEYAFTSAMHRNSIMLLGFCFMLLNCSDALFVQRFLISGIGWYGIWLFCLVFCLLEVVLKKRFSLKSIGVSVGGLVYISLSWGLLINLRSFPIHYSFLENSYGDFGWVLPAIIIATIWINDTMQYLVGSFFGKTTFSSISPNKTWEGTAGGSLLAIITVSVSCYFWLGTNAFFAVIVPTVAAITGTLGDLLESKIKRLAGVKDSGQILPGHGGFLDRFDSLLIATPAVWLILQLLSFLQLL